MALHASRFRFGCRLALFAGTFSLLSLGGVLISGRALAADPPAAAKPATKPAAKKPAPKKKPPEWHGEAAPREVVPGEKVLDALLELGNNRMTAGRYEDAIKTFTDAAQRAPLEPRPLSLRGACYQKMGKLQEAETDFRLALQLDPKAHDDQTTKVRAELGAVLTDSGRPAEAVPILEEAAREKPDMFEAQYNLGVAQEALQNWDKASSAYTLATKLKPIDPNPRATQADAYYNLGAVLRKAGHLEEAIAPTRQAVQLAPDKPHGHFNLGLLLSDAKRYDEAVSELTAATQLADQLAKNGTTPEERTEAKAMMQRSWWRLGMVHLSREKPAEAVSALEQAKSIQATAEVVTDLGLARKKAGDMQRAEGEFRTALQINPKFGTARLHLASILAITGRCDDGLRELAQIPVTPAFQETINRIKARCDYERQIHGK